jgi:hypothetical protein
MERVLSALIVVLAVSFYGVSGFPWKLIHRSIEENVGITLNQIAEPLMENESKVFQTEFHKLASNKNDELTIARQILERVPLIDGYVHFEIILRFEALCIIEFFANIGIMIYRTLFDSWPRVNWLASI